MEGCVGGGAGLEEEGAEFLRAEHSSYFAEGEEGKEGAEDDDGSTEHVVEVEVVPDSSERLVMDQSFDELLEDVEAEAEETEEE